MCSGRLRLITESFTVVIMVIFGINLWDSRAVLEAGGIKWKK